MLAGGGGTTGFEGGATPIADCGGYGAGCPAIMVNGGLQQAFMFANSTLTPAAIRSGVMMCMKLI